MAGRMKEDEPGLLSVSGLVQWLAIRKAPSDPLNRCMP